MKNINTQITEALKTLAEEVEYLNGEIALRNYPRWVLKKDNENVYVNGELDLAYGVWYDAIIEFETEQEVLDFKAKVLASPHNKFDISTYFPYYLEVNQSQVQELQADVNDSIEKIKALQDLIDIPNTPNLQGE